MEKIQRRGFLPYRDPDAPVPFRQGAAHGGHGQFPLRNRQHDGRVRVNELHVRISLPGHAQDHRSDRQAGQFQGQGAGARCPVLLDGTRGKKNRGQEEAEKSVKRHKRVRVIDRWEV